MDTHKAINEILENTENQRHSLHLFNKDKRLRFKVKKTLDALISAVLRENGDTGERQLTIPDVVGQGEQLPCDCRVYPKENTLQVYCPKCFKTWWTK